MENSKSEIDIDCLIRGDHREWRRFVHAVSPVILSVLRKTVATACQNTDEVTDILQEVYLKLCRNDFRLLKRYDPTRARLSTWVAVIARNMGIDYLRRCRPPERSLDRIAAAPESESVLQEERRQLSFDSLPPRQMLIMKLLYEKDLDVRQTARFLGIKEQSVRSARHKAIAVLRKVAAEEKW